MRRLTPYFRAGTLLAAGMALALALALSIPDLKPDVGALTFLVGSLLLAAFVVRFGFVSRPRAVHQLLLRWPATLACAALLAAVVWWWMDRCYLVFGQSCWSSGLHGKGARAALAGIGFATFVVLWPRGRAGNVEATVPRGVTTTATLLSLLVLAPLALLAWQRLLRFHEGRAGFGARALIEPAYQDFRLAYVERAEVTTHGIYASLPWEIGHLSKQHGSEPTLIETTDEVPGRIVTRFGASFRLVGEPEGEPAHVIARVVHPPVNTPDGRTSTIHEWHDWLKLNGTAEFFGWGFSFPWDVVPGDYSIELYVLAAEVNAKVPEGYDGKEYSEIRESERARETLVARRRFRIVTVDAPARAPLCEPLASGPDADDGGSPQAAPVFARFERHTFAGPRYRLDLHRDGRVDYEGIEYVEARGAATLNLSPGSTRAIMRLFEDVDFMSLQDRYNGLADHPGAVVSFSCDGHTKTIAHGGPAPAPLEWLEGGIDRIVGIERLVGAADQGPLSE